jgi:hypothetical protein
VSDFYWFFQNGITNYFVKLVFFICMFSISTNVWQTAFSFWLQVSNFYCFFQNGITRYFVKLVFFICMFSISTNVWQTAFSILVSGKQFLLLFPEWNNPLFCQAGILYLYVFYFNQCLTNDFFHSGISRYT